MSREPISEKVKRRLYAESMGRCMNPSCQKELFSSHGDIIEKAHIVPYCKTVDNSYENLVILCPNCHKDFDKNAAFSPEEVKEWKNIRSAELERFFSRQFASFDELKAEVVPLLLENRLFYEKYYLQDKKELWEKIEPKIIINNQKLSRLLSANLSLFQQHPEKAYSNQECVSEFLLHVQEFETTRADEEKTRSVLFPEAIDSIFGISPVHESFFPSTEALESLIRKLNRKGKFDGIQLGVDNPYFTMIDNGKLCTVFLDDTPQIRQLYFDYGCFRKAGVRLDSLNYALKFLRRKRLYYSFPLNDCLREIELNGIHFIFVYEYCLSKASLLHRAPEENSVLVNLHNWNGASCISREAYAEAEKMNVTLLTMDAFYEYISDIKGKENS